MLDKKDGSGKAQVVLCRVLMGWPEAGESIVVRCVEQGHEHEDSPRIHDYMVSFKWSKLQQMQESSEATSKLKKPSPVACNMFLMLLVEVKQIVTDKCELLKESYNSFKILHGGQALALACSSSSKCLRMDWCLKIIETSLESLLSNCKLLMAINVGYCQQLTMHSWSGKELGFSLN